MHVQPFIAHLTACRIVVAQLQDLPDPSPGSSNRDTNWGTIPSQKRERACRGGRVHAWRLTTLDFMVGSMQALIRQRVSLGP